MRGTQRDKNNGEPEREKLEHSDPAPDPRVSGWATIQERGERPGCVGGEEAEHEGAPAGPRGAKFAYNREDKRQRGQNEGDQPRSTARR
jgi:hypothetical protein